MSGFVLELDRATAQDVNRETFVASERWLHANGAAHKEVYGEGPWDIQIIRWEGEDCKILERHRDTGSEEWHRPITHPPVELMRYAKRVER